MRLHPVWFSRITAAWIAVACPGFAQEIDFPDGVDRVECPLVLLSNGNLPGLPAVEGTLGETPVLFLVDTGANTCGIDRDVVETLGIRQTGSDLLSGVGGVKKVPTYRISGLRFGDMEVSGMRCMGQDVRAFSKGRDVSLGGLLATPFFNRVPTTIDYPARRIVFWNIEEFEPPDAPAIPITAMLGIPLARGQIGGRKVQLVFDTGAEAALLLYPAFVERYLTVGSGEGQPSMRMRGWTGTAGTRYARLGQLALGGITLRDVTTSLLLESSKFGMASDRLRAGIIGTALLSSFVVTLDYRRSRIYLESDGAVQAHHPTGVFFRRVDGALQVAGVINSTPAAERLEAGDELVAIDGRPPPATMFEIYELLRSREETELRVKRDGELLDLMLPRWDSTPPVVFAPQEKR